MSYDSFSCLSVHVDRGVAFVTFNHPPRNALDGSLWPEIVRLQRALESDPEVRVVVFQSAS
jgi:enoyl-CoA hydratase/carnithine racemase